MNKFKAKNVIKTALISAFTIATAFIWRDVVIALIEKFVPPSDELFFKLLTAIIATFILIFAIYIFLSTESQAESFFNRFKKKKGF